MNTMLVHLFPLQKWQCATCCQFYEKSFRTAVMLYLFGKLQRHSYMEVASPCNFPSNDIWQAFIGFLKWASMYVPSRVVCPTSVLESRGGVNSDQLYYFLPGIGVCGVRMDGWGMLQRVLQRLLWDFCLFIALPLSVSPASCKQQPLWKPDTETKCNCPEWTWLQEKWIVWWEKLIGVIQLGEKDQCKGKALIKWELVLDLLGCPW